MKLFAAIGTAIVAALVALTVLFGSWFTVAEGYRGVITRNGAIVGEASPGLHFKVPLIDGVTDMSIQTEKVTFEHMAVYSKDIQQADVRLSVAYRLSGDHVLETYSTVGVSYAEKLLWPAVLRRVKESTGQFTAADIIGARDRIASRILELVVADMQPRGIIVEIVQLENIDFSDTYEAAAEAAAKAEADVKRARQELEQTKVNAQRQVAEAEAAAQAKKATADADAYAVRAAADADAHRLQVQGKARSEALTMQVQALGSAEAVVQNNATLAWDGKLPVTMLPGSALPFVSVK